MANTPDFASCISPNDAGLSSVNPFYALRYQFGMLLGVDDFETEQAYHRGKSRLHNAWLHRDGVVWGMDVQIDPDHKEIRVKPGLALDAAGRELHLDADACVNVPKWFEVHKKDDPGFKPDTKNGVTTFDAHLVIAFQACLTRQVPALMEPCQNSATDTTYSRVFETVKLSLLPGLVKPADLPPRPYHRLRLLFGLEPPQLKKTGSPPPPTDADQEVLDALNAILALPSADQPARYLEAFRKFAALDEIDLQPAAVPDGSSTLFPQADDTVVLLANIHKITLKDNGGTLTLTGGTIDRSVRPSHVATSTIEELLCGPLFSNNPPPPKRKGPQIVGAPDGITADSRTITLKTDSDLNSLSLKSAPFSVTVLDPTTGWRALGIDNVGFASGTVTITLKNTPSDKVPAAGTLVRLIAFGTGPTPILGTNGVPLGGTDDNPNGQDFIYMKTV